MIKMGSKNAANAVNKDYSYIVIEPIIRPSRRGENHNKFFIDCDDFYSKSNSNDKKAEEEQRRRRRRRNKKLKFENKIEKIIRKNEMELNRTMDQQKSAEISSKYSNLFVIIFFITKY